MANKNVVYSAKANPRVVKPDQILRPPFDQLPKYTGAWVEQRNKEIGG